MSVALEWRDIGAGYGRVHVLHEVSAAVRRGELLAVIGPNGAGKTTLLRAVIGSVQIFAGEIVVEGVRISGDKWASGDGGIVMLPQGQNVFVDMTIAENVQVAAHTFCRSHADRVRYRQRVSALLGRAAGMNRKVLTLSGGERQRLALSLTLAVRAHLFLLDEPLLNLSPDGRVSALSWIRECVDAGAAAVVVEQNVTDILSVADRVLILKSGSIATTARPSDLTDDVLRREWFA
ncbi:MAG TPA: ATP-binding cassette domain-containing protein [Thermoanaerobaculia bacterium]|jgi:branched-chain amino acid transport system ATP-binding protein